MNGFKMFRIFDRPLVQIAQQNPNWTCGRELSILNSNIAGFCYVSLSSKTHPKWKPISIICFEKNNFSFMAPINANITINTWSFRGKSKDSFTVGKPTWNINPPTLKTINTKYKKISVSDLVKDINSKRIEFIKFLKFGRQKNSLKAKIQLHKISYFKPLPRFKLCRNMLRLK